MLLALTLKNEKQNNYQINLNINTEICYRFKILTRILMVSLTSVKTTLMKRWEQMSMNSKKQNRCLIRSKNLCMFFKFN